MKSILIPGATILVIIYTVLFFIDHQIWPENNGAKIRNIILLTLSVYLAYNLISIYLLKNTNEETALAYRIAATGKLLFTKAADHIRPFQKELLLWTLVAIGFSIIGLLLLGLPGALFLEIPVKLGICKRIQNDNAWPAFIFLSVIWPIFLPAAVLTKYYLIGRGYSAYAFIGLLGVIAAGIIFSMMVTYWMFQED